MNPDLLAAFRRRVSHRARQCSKQWEDSKKLIEGTILPSTLAQLHHAIQDKDLPVSVKEPLLRLFERKTASRVQDLDGECLKSLTGFPPAKALRALSVFFELVPTPGSRWPMTRLTSEAIERLVRRTGNPFDLLCHADVASLLEIGAGDLSFAEELVDRYGAELKHQQDRQFIVHCLDRLDPRSRLGGPLHANQDRLQRLQQRPGLSFAFFGNQDMFELEQLDAQGLLAPRYTIATCWAPATPTFAYEPTRLSRSLIDQELIRTKGAFRQMRFEREQALEVAHGDRLLLFPPWKFEIVGPLALLSLLACRGTLCVLGSVDEQVFWELLAQLLDESRYRPQEEPFNTVTVPQVFGDLYDALVGLPVGESIDLSSLATLRRQYPRSGDGFVGAFRYIHIRRGATFPNSPASSTARKFSSMNEEVPPWMLTLVPA